MPTISEESENVETTEPDKSDELKEELNETKQNLEEINLDDIIEIEDINATSKDDETKNSEKKTKNFTFFD